MVLVIKGEEGERGILILYLRFENCFVPGEHFVEAPRHIHDVRQFCRSCHLFSSFVVCLLLHAFVRPRRSSRRCGSARECVGFQWLIHWAQAHCGNPIFRNSSPKRGSERKGSMNGSTFNRGRNQSCA